MYFDDDDDDDDDDPGYCDIHLMAAVAPQMLQLGERARTNTDNICHSGF